MALKNYVFGATTVCVDDPATGQSIFVKQGDVWRADDPFVALRSDLFTDEPSNVRQSRELPPLIEVTSAAPGTRRAARNG